MNSKLVKFVAMHGLSKLKMSQKTFRKINEEREADQNSAEAMGSLNVVLDPEIEDGVIQVLDENEKVVEEAKGLGE